MLNAITVVLDDANRSRRKYFLKQNDRYVEIFTTKRYREHQLGQLHYADETLVPIEATVVTTNDGAQNRYFEINSNDTVTEIYSPRAKDYLRTLESSYLPSSLLCKILLTCTKDNCTITHSLIQHAITKSNIPDLIRYTLNLDPDSDLDLDLDFEAPDIAYDDTISESTSHHIDQNNFKRRNGDLIKASEYTILTIPDDTHSHIKKYFFINAQQKYEEVFLHHRWNIQKLFALHYQDGTRVPYDTLVITTSDGTYNRYFEIKPDHTVVEIYSPHDSVAPSNATLFPDSPLCQVLLSCCAHHCPIQETLTINYSDTPITTLMNIALNLGIERQLATSDDNPDNTSDGSVSLNYFG